MAPPIRVAHVGTGNVGSLALAGILGNPRYELTAVCVSTPAKVGKDAGELSGLDIVAGIEAVDDLGAALATDPDCVVYCAMGDTRMPDAMKDCQRILEAGVNVVGSAPVVLGYPWKTMPDKYIDRIDDAAKTAGVSLFVTGVDPGFANDLIPLAFASTCQNIEQVRCTEIADYATYDGAEVMFEVMGFGKSEDEIPMLYQPGVLSFAWGSVIRQLAEGLGIDIDSIEDLVEREPAPEAFDIAAGHIPKGGLAAVRFEIRGISQGHPAIVVEHVTRLREDLAPQWPQSAQPGGSYRVEIVGEPSYVVDIKPTSRKGDHNHAAIVAAAGRIVNAIPTVVAAAPGIRTTLDLPFVTGHGLYSHPTK